MNSQSAWIPASKRTRREKLRTKSKIFFSFITPDLGLGEIAKSNCVLRALIQQRQERTERRCPHEAGRTNGSGVCGRSVREDVRVKEEWPNPGRGEQCDRGEANVKLRGADERRLTCMLVAA